MARALPRKALIAISSYHGAIYPNGKRTGLFLTEALHPFEVLTETGTYGLDDVSLTEPFKSGSDKAVFDNPKHPFNVKLKSQLKKASDLWALKTVLNGRGDELVDLAVTNIIR